ncbi:MAG: T9SS type A sorting domain-containing protein [Bacteroidales bacterium]|nr:T9SS type A sorting domain-containing protein [Bacteroidales bacterium]
MKNILTILLCLFAIVLGAQPLTLKYDNAVIPNDGTIYVTSTEGVSTNTYIEFTNDQQDAVFFRIRKQVLTSVSSDAITFCVGGTCYTGNLSQELYLNPGQTWGLDDETNVFHASYSHQAAGNQRVRFTIVNSDDANDTISFIIHYTTTTGVQDVPSVTKLSAYPNPASSSVTLEYSASNVHNAFLVIRNLTGMEVYRTPVSISGKSTVDVSSFRAGVYFYGIESDGRMLSSKKLLVK